MKQSEADRLANNLASKFGLPVKAVTKSGPEGQFIFVEPEGVHPNEGFQIKIQIGWRSLFMEMLPGKFASELLQQMASCDVSNKHIFSSIIEHITMEKGIVDLKVNGSIINPGIPEQWPDNWRSLNFSLKKSPVEINTDDHDLTEQLINIWVERFYGCIIALCPLEEITDSEDIDGLPEGALTKILVNRYERSRYNRTMCINFHGLSCKVCNMTFGSRYGNIGQDFIHVHHMTPVSEMGANYIVNPINDLIPVCPNCHAMLHKKDPPYKVEELRAILQF